MTDKRLSAREMFPRRGRGRPKLHPDLKYRPVFMKIAPQTLAAVREEAERRGIGYQTLINDVLANAAYRWSQR